MLEAVANGPIARFQRAAKWIGYEGQRAARTEVDGVPRWRTEVHRFL
jgi:hypothetical protein